MPNNDSTQNLTPITNVYQIYDSKAQTFSYPLYFDNPEAADSWFDTITNVHGCGVTHTSPEDFIVYHTGTYDAESGLTTTFESRVFYVSLGGLRRPCKACDQVAKQAEQVIANHYKGAKQK